ncbi:MAG: hypothetical protein CMJ78_06250 [Planctomycetaceae bacterium]|nr:hypothetical protein [Planctomycetaceae bacterium]
MKRGTCQSLTTHSRRGGTTLQIMVTLGCFAVVAASYFAWSTSSAEQSVAGTAPKATPAVAATPETQSEVIIQKVEDEVDVALPTNDEQDVVAAAPKEAVVVESVSLEDQLQAHLEFGEFVSAEKLARSVKVPEQRATLLRQVALAQIAAGDFDAAKATVGRMPVGQIRDGAQRDRMNQQALAGGAQADFQPLIDLIIQETSGPWVDDEGTGGTVSQFNQGVYVDPKGLLSRLSKADHSGQLQALGIEARQADLNTDLAKASKMRMVSLTRLEREVARCIEDGRSIAKTMKLMAGIHQIQYVFVFPEENEIVIAGPAEGWKYNETGQPIGAESGRPVLQLDDMVTLLRTYSEDGMQIFGCSINPRQEGLAKLKAFVEASRSPLSPRRVGRWVDQLQSQLGLQDIEIYGVPAESRVARVIVEADYRMKLIGIDRMEGAEIPSIFDLFTKEEQTSGKLDALRWWLTMKYAGLAHTLDRNAFELQGSSVLCQSENQFITAQGKQIQTGKADATNARFAAAFTEHYAKLAQRDLVFADMQNIFDAGLVAAILQHEKTTDRLGWDLGVFASTGEYQPARYNTPKTVDSVVNHRVYRGRDIVVQVAGGVRADLASVVKSGKLQESKRLEFVDDRGRARQLPEGRWWWDVAEK